MSRTLTYGMVGGGPGAFIGEAHRKAIALDGSARLVAGCFSRSPEKTRALGEELGLDPERCYADYREMARAEAQREDGIDFVVVVTPNVTHYEICKAFLEAGIHVSCDKPLATDSAQGEELKQLAQEKGLLFMVTYTYTGHVTAKYIRDLIRAGEIGTIRTVMAEYPQGWLYSEDDCGGKQGAWRCDPAQSGRVNCLGDIGTHVENAVATMTGLKIKRLLAKMDVVVPGRKLDDNKGTILWDQERCEEITLIREDGVARTIKRGYKAVTPAAAKYGRLPAGHTEGWLEAMGNLYDSFTQCVAAKQAGTFTEDMIDYPTIDAGIQGLKYVEACLESNEKGNVWVTL